MTFESLISNPKMVANLQNLGFKAPTSIQEKSIPLILNKEDIIAKAKTGSGKTAAFGVPMLLGLDIKQRKQIQTLILTPTRELTNQVATELRKLARFEENIKILTLSGGVPTRAQINSLKHGAHIIVGTPGRIIDLIGKGELLLDKVKTLILDEADKMLDMGFLSDIENILEQLSPKRQTLLFSATFDTPIKALAKKYLKNPTEIEVQEEVSIEEIFLHVPKEEKEKILLGVLAKYRPTSCIIFSNFKNDSLELEGFLQQNGFDALCINSDLEQIDRDETLIKFSNGSITFLIATDVASRGLDIKNVELVINYDMPRNDETYTHRIGRTGRHDKTGRAISFSESPANCDELSLHVKASCHGYEAKMSTFCINGGKKEKLRAGDIVGALIKEIGLDAAFIGVINVTDFYSYVAIDRNYEKKVFNKLKNCNIKARRYKIWVV